MSACWRPWLLRRSIWIKTVGAINVISANTSITAATGTSQKAIKAKIANRRQHRDRHLRHVLTEKGLQLLDPVDDRQHDPAGALAGKPSRPQFGDLVVKPAAQFLCTRAAVRARPCSAMVDHAAHDHSRGDADRRDSNRHRTRRPRRHATAGRRECEARDAERPRRRALTGSQTRSIRAARVSAATISGQNTSAFTPWSAAVMAPVRSARPQVGSLGIVLWLI